MKMIVHVHRQRIRQDKPAIIVRTYKGVRYTRQFQLAPEVIIKQPGKQLHCGAKVWIEVER